MLSPVPRDSHGNPVTRGTPEKMSASTVYAQANPAMDPETRDPGTYHSPSRSPTEPSGPGSGKQPPGVSQHTPKHPAPDTENHKYTGRQRYQPPAGSVVHKNHTTHAPNVKTNNNGRCTLTHTPQTYSILPGPGADTLQGQPAPGPRR
ncbi:hypothetical protein ILYODFUR_037221 [Ilyodon furcidens]|uniref:Uncharacterized protein n=1 Tax=Ilyodon furcidens TaxID=33524 RepID=A0ABV0V0K9_9TELE